MKERREARRRALMELAGRQDGIVTRRDALNLGLTSDDVVRLVRRDVLHPVHRGVYHVGHPAPSRRARHRAASVAFGGTAGISHRPAAALRGVVFDDGAPIEVTTATGVRGTRDGVRVHVARGLTADDLVIVQGIACVTLERAMLDVAARDRTQFALLFDAADRKRLVDPQRIARELGRGRPGSTVVGARLRSYAGPELTESELEERFLTRVVRHYGLPEPTLQASPLPHRSQRVDVTWPGPRVAVELDSRTWHAIQATWGEDHERDLALRRAGWIPLRYTFNQVCEHPGDVADDLRRALDGRRG